MKKLFLGLLAACCAATVSAADKKIVLLAGAPSHGAGEHEHRAGLMLLQASLAGVPGIKVELFSLAGNVWVPDEAVFNDAAAVIIYSDGEGGHPLLRDDRLQKMGALMAKGVGLGLMHYATEPLTARGHDELIAWTGGAYEANYSLNPIYLGEFKSLPRHPVTRGVRPFATTDEWYYHIRFRPGMQGVTPILSLVPPLSSLNRPDVPRLGAHEGNEDAWAAVRRRETETLMWVTERPDGGRGFGFTGGHYHANWANDDQRKLVLNAILWVAGVEVPANGVQSKVTSAMLRANLDPKGGRGGAAPNATLSSVTALTALPRQKVTDARRALLFNSLTNPTALREKATELAAATLELAQTRAALFAEIQATPERFTAEQIATLVQQAGQ